MHFKRVCLFNLLVYVFISINAQTSAVFPGEDWDWYSRQELADLGYDYEALMQARNYIVDSLNTTGLVVAVNGKMLAQYGDIEDLSYLASCRKSILAILYGIYVDNGAIDLSKTLKDLGIDDLQGLSDLEKTATIKDIISARSGIYHPASNPGDNTADAPPRGSQKPGTYFLYNNWDFNAAGAIFEQEAGINIYDAIQKHLAQPIGMQDFDRGAQHKSGDRNRSKFQAYHIWLSTRDMARIGHLMLHNGKWKDQQVIPQKWVKEMVSMITPVQEMNPPFFREGEIGYGYMWWVWDENLARPELKGAYSARGAYGQYITVLPELDMVIAHKTNSVYRRSTNWDGYMGIINRVLDARK